MSDNSYEFKRKNLPCDTASERALLVTMALNSDGANEILHSIKTKEFCSRKHQIFFDALMNTINKGAEVDFLMIKNYVENKYGDLSVIGGVEYILEILDYKAPPTNYKEYIKIVKDKAVLRRMLEISNEIVDKIYNMEGNVAKDILSYMESQVFQISDENITGDFVAISDVLIDTVQELENMATSRSIVQGIPTGFRDLDSIIGGFKPGELILLAARPSMGKTSLALNIAQHMAIEENKVIAFFSLEMDIDSLVKRILCSEGRIDQKIFSYGKKTQMRDYLQRLAQAASCLKRTKFYIDDTPATTPSDIRAKCRRLKSKEKQLDVIFIDYLQLLSGSTKAENRQQEIASISRELKILAKEIGAPVIALSQLNRSLEQRRDKVPLLSDLRESGALEQDADIVIFLHREEFYEETEENRGKSEVIVQKNRNGPRGTATLTFIKEITRFENYTEGEAMHI